MNSVVKQDDNGASFQGRVLPWLLACFGAEIAADGVERNHRFLEESLELVQACGATRSEAHQLVDYVFNRPVGEKPQEVGGVMVTLAALCLAQNIDMHQAGEIELERIWTKVEAIRAKQAAKPKHSPLPAKPPIENGDRLSARFGISGESMREKIKPLFFAMYDHGITSVKIELRGTTVNLTVDGKTI